MKDIITERIVTRQAELGLSNRQFAERLYMSPKAITDWRSGRNHPRCVDIPDICNALECRPDYLFGFDDKPEKAQHWLWKE